MQTGRPSSMALRPNLESDPGPDLPELGIGVVYSAGLEPLLERFPESIDVLEIEPQTMWLERANRPDEILVQPEVEAHLASLPFRKLVHSIGTPVGGSVPGIEMQLPLLRDAVQKLNAPWASEHLAFNLTPDFFTGFFLPPRQTAMGLDVYAAAITRLRAALGVPLAIETGVNYLQPRADEIPDGEFVAELVERTGCGILLDLHNIYANECNGRQEVFEFLKQIPLDHVWEIHVAGGFELQGYWLDAHSGAIPDRLFELSHDIVPQLPNLKAMIFEVFSSFLPAFGVDGVRKEMERVRKLWEFRRPSWGRTRMRGAGSLPRSAPAASVTEWESALGGLAIGRAPDTALGEELAADPGTALVCDLVHQFRASMVVSVYRLSCRLMMLALTPDVFQAVLEDFWTHESPHPYAASEAEAFIAFLRTKNVLRIPKLEKVLEFEKAAMDTLLDGQTRVVRFSADPFPLLRALAEGRLPDVVPQEGDYEIELKPDGPVSVTGMDPEQLRGAFPFH
jgi:uncharacterized protein (UPF0276 family)